MLSCDAHSRCFVGWKAPLLHSPRLTPYGNLKLRDAVNPLRRSNSSTQLLRRPTSDGIAIIGPTCTHCPRRYAACDANMCHTGFLPPVPNINCAINPQDERNTEWLTLFFAGPVSAEAAAAATDDAGFSQHLRRRFPFSPNKSSPPRRRQRATPMTFRHPHPHHLKRVRHLTTKKKKKKKRGAFRRSQCRHERANSGFPCGRARTIGVPLQRFMGSRSFLCDCFCCRRTCRREI